MKIALFDKLDNKIVYIEDIVTCRKGAEITTRLEFLTDTYDAIPFDRLVNTDRFIIGTSELQELVIEVDKKYSKLYDYWNEKENT